MAGRQGRPLRPHTLPGPPRAGDEVLGLYLHIPFCQAICSYCNFNRGLYDAALKDRYVSALAREIREAGDGQPVDTIFFGGGTPSLLDADEIATLLAACREAYDVQPDAEVTLESNPETVTVERFSGFLGAGINRVSLGAQSFDNEQLKRLGRIHDATRIGEAVDAARQAGCTNLSLDLMLWLPGQAMGAWLDSVQHAIALDPDHLSLYLLELYPNAPLKEAMARAKGSGIPNAGTSRHEWIQATDDEAADMYLEGLALLDAGGYEQYEISNVSRPDRESRHNLKYWTSGRWRGFGCGAHSTVADRRWQNIASTSEYADHVLSARPVRIGEQIRSRQEQVEESLFTGLRLTRGIDGGEFQSRFGVDPWGCYGERLTGALDAGLVWREGERFGLTRQGMLLANEILAAFV